MKKTLTIILAGGAGSRLNILSYKRAKPAVPFGGKYRIIDFVLSNCVNSGLYDVQILTQYRPYSLNNHIRAGQPWDLDRLYGGVELLQPHQNYDSEATWYKGTADAIYQNLQYVEEKSCDYILILSGDHIYKMDYSEMIDFHEKADADLTISVIPIEPKDAFRFGILQLNEEKRVINFQEKPKTKPLSNLASMGIYVFKKDVLLDELIKDGKNPNSDHDFGKNIIPSMIKRMRVYGFEYDDYWRDVGTIQSYWEANMDLLEEHSTPSIFDANWVIHTRSEEKPPVKFPNESGCAYQSLVSNGCTILGKVERSVLSPGVFIDENALVKDCIILSNTYIGKNAKINRSILDKNVVVNSDVVMGFSAENTINSDFPNHLNTGITLVGKNAKIPPNTVIGKNCLIMPDATEDDFMEKSELKSGDTIGNAEKE